MSLEEEMEKNLFVFSRDKNEDYHFYCENGKATKIKLKDAIHSLANQLYRTRKSLPARTGWYCFETRTQGSVVMRSVIDGRRDAYGREIIRTEGTVLPPELIGENEEGVAEEFFDTLEKVLAKKQIETNNYGYGELEKFVKHHEDSTR